METNRRNYKHGMFDTRGYTSWAGIKQVCNNPNNVSYHLYGGRGIKVCDRWSKFENFFADMGSRPEKTSLHCLDKNADFCKENCRWGTLWCGLNKQQKKKKMDTNRNSCTHGMTYTKVYRAWLDIKQLCSNPNNRQYHLYGSRGIKVCARWRKFENFLSDMGDLPKETSLIRIDRSGNFCKKNCKWENLNHDMINTKVYRSWANIKQICSNPNNVSYYLYGKKGIKVCDRWSKFNSFFSDVGRPPEEGFLRRIDKNGNFCKENCKWKVYDTSQTKNKRRENGKK